jgi:PKD domain
LLALATVSAAPAHAAGPIDVYASQDGTNIANTMPPCPQSDPCDLSHALTAAGANSGGGTVHVIGQLTWTGNTLDVGTTSGNPVYLLGNGSGTGGTVIDVSQPTALRVSYGSAVNDVRVRAQDVAVDLAYGSTLTDSVVQATATSSTGVAAAALTGALSSAQATLANDSVTAGEVAVNAASGSTSQHLVIEDSTLGGFSGIVDAKVPAEVFRSTINADGGFGLDFENGQTSYVSSSVIHMSGSNFGPVGAYVAGPTTLYLIQDTIDGVDSSGINETGVLATEGFMLTESNAIVRDSIVRGFTNDLWAQGGSGTNAGGYITVSRSDYSTQRLDTGSNGQINEGGGNVDQEPSFVDRPGGDYRLRFDSPLIDAGGNSPLDANEDSTDRGGTTPRLTDGDNSGTAERDIGAFEYVFARPAASFTAAPQPGLTGHAVAFDATASTYSIGPIADYAWDLDGNGSFETSTGADPHASRVYATPGTVTVGLRVTGFDGGPAQTTRDVVVQQGPPGPGGGQPGGGRRIKLLGRTLTLSRAGFVKVRVGCDASAPAPCQGGIRIRAALPARKRAAASRRRITLGHASATIPSGKTASVKVKLSRKARRLVRAQSLRRATVTASQAGAPKLAKTYRLKPSASHLRSAAIL